MIRPPGWMLRKRLRWRSTTRSKRSLRRLLTLSCRSCTLRQVRVQVQVQEDSPLVPSQVVLSMSTPLPVMYWSRAPVWGSLPTHGFRAHTVTLADDVAWIFGGCDDRGCFKDMWCFNTGPWVVFFVCHGAESAHDFDFFPHHSDITETMQWSHPEMQGDLPPPCRVHSATLIGCKIVIIGGGEGTSYYNSVFVFDIPTRRWSRPTFTTMDIPP